MRKNKDMNDARRLSLLEEYMSSSLSKRKFETEKGLRHGSVSNWIRNFGLEDKPKERKSTMNKTELSSEKSNEEELVTTNPQDEIKRLRDQLRAKELELKKSNILRDAYSKMIELAEEKYSIPIRKNSGAK